MEERKRPAVVTIVAWVIILLSCLSLLSSLLTPLALMSPEGRQKFEETGQSVASILIWGIVAGAVGLVCGIAIFNGANWGRVLYLVFTPVSMVLQWVLYGFKPMSFVGIGIYAVILILLTTSAASQFFGRQPEQVPESGK
ncbi:MAG: hypothetical protein FJY66_02525 [Calditrichaeota bacterium]|nr:hypothetical protein [Calditrichota bacterium]